LVSAAEHGQKDIVEFLLANKADVNGKDSGGNTPLYAASLFTRILSLNPCKTNQTD
jgi:ankyrin repeat protein